MKETESHRRIAAFELDNVGSGQATVDAATLAEDGEYAVVVLLASHYCPRSRELVRTLRDHYGAFRERATAVVPVLPAIRERANLWDRQYDLPFPLLVDPGDDGAFGVFEPFQRTCESLPCVVLCECRPAGLRLVSTMAQPSSSVPTVGTLLDEIDSVRG